jgi:hypothetical protein
MGIQFVAPWILATIPLGIGLLLYLYRQRGNNKAVRIPTLFLLRQFSGPPLRQRRFVPPIRFFVESAILLLFALGASGASAGRYGRRIAFVIDNSFSSFVRLGDGSKAIDTVRSKSLEVLRTEYSNDLVELFYSSPSLTSVTNGFIPSSDVAGLIGDINSAYSDGDLSIRASTLINRENQDLVVLATSRPTQIDPSLAGKIVTLPLGIQTASNVALESSWVEAGSHIMARVHGFTEREAVVTIALYGLPRGGSPQELLKRDIKLAPFIPVEVPLGDVKSEFVGYHVQILSPKDPGVNAVLTDDDAWITTTSTGSQIGFVSPIPMKELGLLRLFGSAIKEIPVSEIESTPPQIVGWIFHRMAPQHAKNKPSLYIVPPSGAASLKSSPSGGGLAITSWENGSPILKYLSPTAISGESGIEFAPPPWPHTSILQSSHGSVILEGIQNHATMVASGLELLPFRGSETPLKSILLLNIVRYVFPEAVSSSWRTYSSPSNKKIQYLYYTKTEGIDYPSSRLEIPGIVAVTDGDTTTYEAVSYYSEKESSLLDRQPIIINRSGSTVSSDKGTPSPWFKNLAILTLILLMVESALELRRNRLRRVAL